MKGRACPIYRDNLRQAEDLGRAGRRLRRNFEICEACVDASQCHPHCGFPPSLAEALRLAAVELSENAEESQ